jgi:hypothetical protein
VAAVRDESKPSAVVSKTQRSAPTADLQGSLGVRRALEMRVWVPMSVQHGGCMKRGDEAEERAGAGGV